MEVDTDSIIALMSFLVGSYIFISKNVKFPTKKELEEKYKKEKLRQKEEKKEKEKEKKAKEKEEKKQSISKVDNLIDTLVGRSKEDREKLEEITKKRKEEEEDKKKEEDLNQEENELSKTELKQLEDFINKFDHLLKTHEKKFKSGILYNKEDRTKLKELKKLYDNTKKEKEDNTLKILAKADELGLLIKLQKVTPIKLPSPSSSPPSSPRSSSPSSPSSTSSRSTINTLQPSSPRPSSSPPSSPRSSSPLSSPLSNLPSSRSSSQVVNLQEEEIPNSTNNNDFNKPVDKNFIYLGDLFDSSCKGEKGGIEGCKPDNFSFNIRNLRFLKKNKDNSQIFLGNRDINKLKLLELLKFKDENNWENIFNKKANILTIAKDLSKKIQDKNDVFKWKYNTKEEWEEESLKPIWGLHKIKDDKNDKFEKYNYDEFNEITNEDKKKK